MALFFEGLAIGTLVTAAVAAIFFRAVRPDMLVVGEAIRIRKDAYERCLEAFYEARQWIDENKEVIAALQELDPDDWEYRPLEGVLEKLPCGPNVPPSFWV